MRSGSPASGKGIGKGRSQSPLPKINQICKYWLEGTCKLGKQCRYLHSQQQKQKAAPAKEINAEAPSLKAKAAPAPKAKAKAKAAATPAIIRFMTCMAALTSAAGSCIDSKRRATVAFGKTTMRKFRVWGTEFWPTPPLGHDLTW